MAQQPIELILLRQWASYLDIPLWLMDADGDLLYYNEPAEDLLGLRFDEAGSINAAELSSMFVTTNLDGSPMSTEEIPIVRTLNSGHPAHGEVRFSAADGTWRHVGVTAFPVDALGRRLGVVAMLWELRDA
jgi:PAS domain S-box-containing protein